MLASVVDWAALAQVVAYSFAAALLLTLVFTTGVLSFADHERRTAVGTVAFGLCLALVALGLYVMFTNK
jgi:hypothetical protein